MNTISIATISTLIISILTGAIQGFHPLNFIYQVLFNQELPVHLLLGFSAIGTFTLYYTLFTLLVLLPLYCYFGLRLDHIGDGDIISTPSKEDILYLILIYLAYIYVCYTNEILTKEAMVMGIFAILLPFFYRGVVYVVNDALKKYQKQCIYPLILFLVSFIFSVLLTIPYLYVLHYVSEWVIGWLSWG